MNKVFIVAEMSGNHGGSFNKARDIVVAAAEVGADAIKLQTFPTADALTIDVDNQWTRITGGAWAGRTLYQLYQEACTPIGWHAALRDIAYVHGIELFSTPFSIEAVEFLDWIGVKRYKVASYEICDYELLDAINKKRKPVIMSTGMATGNEIMAALAYLRDCPVTLLKCTAAYPAQIADMNLVTLRYLKNFAPEVGLSDHSLSTIIPAIAVGAGATVIEKHLTLLRTKGDIDSEFSLEPHEFAEMVRNVREAEAGMGEVKFGPTESEKTNMMFRRSVFSVKSIKAGETFTRENVRVIRPGYGLHPSKFEWLLGKTAMRDIEVGWPIAEVDTAG